MATRKKTAPKRVSAGKAKKAAFKKAAAPAKSASRKRTAPKPAAKKKAAAKKTKKTAKKAPRALKRPQLQEVLLAPVTGAESREVGHVRLDVGPAGAARVKRLIYPPGFRWSVDMKPIVRTSLCMHAHVGFLVQGEIHIEYSDGCVVEHRAPQIVAIDPGHDGWVVGKEPVVMIEFDFDRETVEKLGMPSFHRHG